MNALLGKALPAGGTIGIVTPASPYSKYSDVLRGIAWWESKGYQVKLAEGALARTDYFAGSPQLRADDLMTMFTDPTVDVIQCLRGGFGSAEIIPDIDFKVIADNPKPFIGLSDITSLHTALAHYTGLATFYGPSLTQVATMSQFNQDWMLRVLGGDTTFEYPRNPDDPFVRALGLGQATGRLVGGCFSDMMTTLATPWEVDLDDAILALEEVGSSPHGIERNLIHLAQAGKLKNLRGVVIGDLTGCEYDEGGGSPFPYTKGLEEVFEQRLGALGIPVLYGLPFGHGPQFATLPLGVQATVNADTLKFVITESSLHQN